MFKHDKKMCSVRFAEHHEECKFSSKAKVRVDLTDDYSMITFC